MKTAIYIIIRHAAMFLAAALHHHDRKKRVDRYLDPFTMASTTVPPVRLPYDLEIQPPKRITTHLDLFEYHYTKLRTANDKEMLEWAWSSCTEVMNHLLRDERYEDAAKLRDFMVELPVHLERSAMATAARP
jgi:hypothetical protein